MQGREPIRFGTYNICNVRTRGLESKLREIYQANMDLGIFQETKLIGGVYTSRSDGYSIVATDALRRHCGRVAVFYFRSVVGFIIIIAFYISIYGFDANVCYPET